MTVTEQTWVPHADTFAKRLVFLRVELGLTQAEAATACSIKQPTWASWEAGAAPRNMVDVVAAISKAFGVDREWLAWGDAMNACFPDTPASTSTFIGALGQMSFDDVYRVPPYVATERADSEGELAVAGAA